MPNLTAHDLLQMDEAWQCAQPDLVVRGLVKRALEDLRVVRDCLNQMPANNARPSGRLPPWQCVARGGSAYEGSVGDGHADDAPFGQVAGGEAARTNKSTDAQDAAPQHGGSAESKGQTQPDAHCASAEPTQALDVVLAKRAGRHVEWVEQLHQLCEQHRDDSDKALQAVVREFLNDWNVITRPLADPKLPLTNNAAERQLRPSVIPRRISHGTRTPVGSHGSALLASIIDTCRLRGARATAFLARAIHAARSGLPAPRLKSSPPHLVFNTALVAA